MPLIFKPAFWSWRIACSRPAPGPLTLTSISIIPLFRASDAAFSAARPAANGVLLRAPLNPTVPADAHEIVSPLVSVIVTIVLLNVALMCATPRVTPLRIFFFGAPGLPAAAAPPFACSDIGSVPLYADLPGYAVPAECLCKYSAYEATPLCGAPFSHATDAASRVVSWRTRLRRARATVYLPSSFTPFLPATVLRGPLRVRALERVRWPRV